MWRLETRQFVTSLTKYLLNISQNNVLTELDGAEYQLIQTSLGSMEQLSTGDDKM